MSQMLPRPNGNEAKTTGSGSLQMVRRIHPSETPMKSPDSVILSALSALIGALFSLPLTAQTVSFSDIQKLPKPPADHRIAYGDDPSQFGELRLPKTKGKFPVVIVVHGGCWFAEYDLNHIAAFSDAITKLGVATWTIEYRRIGDKGGAWPGTFQDVAKATDQLRDVAKQFPLDMKRVIVIGHSAGGQLALWLAARRQLPKASELFSNSPLSLKGVISLAGISDLKQYRPNCDDSVNKLLGGAPEQYGERYQQTSPMELLPLRVPIRLIHGAKDRIVPLEMGKVFENAARKKRDDIQLITLETAGHFELISPIAPAWQTVSEQIRSLLKLK